jgi:hypothetical protein
MHSHPPLTCGPGVQVWRGGPGLGGLVSWCTGGGLLAPAARLQ